MLGRYEKVWENTYINQFPWEEPIGWEWEVGRAVEGAGIISHALLLEV